MNITISPRDLEGLPITLRRHVPEEYRDLMGHMNVMWYTHLFSCAFEAFAEQFGFGEAYFRANQMGSFALETHVRYLAEVRIGNHVTIRSRLLGRSAKRIHFMHFMTVDETGALAAIQEHVGAHIDMRIRRMAPLPSELTDRFDKLVEAHNKLGWEAPVCGVMRP
jgi:acyl-CoA thioester hydrolase